VNETSYLDTLEMFDKYLETEEIELSRFVQNNGINTYSSTLRAFKFGLKFIFLTPQVVSEKDDGGMRVSDVVDARGYCDIFRKHIAFFIALDLAEINIDDWVVMNMTDDIIYLLLKSSDSNHLKTILEELKKAKEKSIKSGWSGKVYYKIIDAGGQNEL